MNDIPTSLPGVLLLEPKVLGHAPGVFLTSSSKRALTEANGAAATFVEEHCGRSLHGVLRSLHQGGRPPKCERARELRSTLGDVAVERYMVSNDHQLAIAWPQGGLALIASAKSQAAARLTEAEVFG